MFLHDIRQNIQIFEILGREELRIDYITIQLKFSFRYEISSLLGGEFDGEHLQLNF